MSTGHTASLVHDDEVECSQRCRRNPHVPHDPAGHGHLRVGHRLLRIAPVACCVDAGVLAKLADGSLVGFERAEDVFPPVSLRLELGRFAHQVLVAPGERLFLPRRRAASVRTSSRLSILSRWVRSRAQVQASGQRTRNIASSPGAVQRHRSSREPRAGRRRADRSRRPGRACLPGHWITPRSREPQRAGRRSRRRSSRPRCRSRRAHARPVRADVRRRVRYSARRQTTGASAGRRSSPYAPNLWLRRARGRQC